METIIRYVAFFLIVGGGIYAAAWLAWQKYKHEHPGDNGHRKLMADLFDLVSEADRYNFHDFLNTAYPAPKMELVKQLERIIAWTKEGKYDNASEDEK